MNKQELEQAIRAANEAGARYRPVESVKPKVLANALAGFARGCPAGEAVALYDTTILSSGKTGFLVSTTAIYHDSFDFLLKKGGSKRLALDGLVGLEPDDRNRLMRGYSHGMKHKIQMLCFLIGRPPVILLDEPLTSFDVVAALEMKNLLREMKGDHIILFSTHILQLAQDLCDEIVLLSHGELEVVEKSNLDDHAFKEKIIAALKEESHA